MEAKDGVAVGLNDAKSSGLLPFVPNGSAAAIALAGVATLIVSGVALAKHEYNKHKSRKHLAKIKKVLEFHNEYLVDILNAGVEEHPSLPPPFILDDKDNPSSAMALKLNLAIRK